jgi:NADH-quinone oxidoreductase subunit C
VVVSTWALDQLHAQLPLALAERYVDRTGAEWGVLHREHLEAAMRLLKGVLHFKMFVTIEGLDRLQLPTPEPRFEVAYVVYNLERSEHARLKVRVTEDDPEIPTIRRVYQGAEWSERLVWDFYGVRFTDHGDLRRMLTYEEFKGHPLRKDYGLRDRQPLTPERPIKDIFRGPGTSGVP